MSNGLAAKDGKTTGTTYVAWKTGSLGNIARIVISPGSTTASPCFDATIGILYRDCGTLSACANRSREVKDPPAYPYREVTIPL